ncbi:MAG: biopolymer transporter ExbD [Rubrivivax sp.]
MRHRRLRRRPAALEITALLNLIVVLVPFLLSTAVFSRLAVMELALPAAGGHPAVEQLQVERLQLEVVLRADHLELADRIGGRIARIDAGADELAALSALLLQLKARFPDERRAHLLADPDTPYERLLRVMATLRSTGGRQPAELFPQVAVGDAPLKGRT